MKKLFLLLLFAFPAFVNAQSFYAEFAQHDTSQAQPFQAICRDSTGMIDAGGVLFDSAGVARTIFVQFASSGSPVVSRRLITSTSGTGVSCLASDAGGFWAVCGAGPYYTILVRMDQNFNVLWSRHIYAAGHNVIANSCRPAPGGGCYVCGYYYQPSVFNMAQLTFIMRYDANGNVLWSNLYTLNDHAFLAISPDAQAVKDGFITPVFIRHQDTISATHVYYAAGLMKIDSTGNTDWLKVFADTTYHYPVCMTMLSDSSFVFGGISDIYPGSGVYEAFFTRTDKNGERLWTRRVAQSPSFLTSYGVTETDQHRILFVSGNPNDSSMALIEADTVGNYLAGQSLGMINVVRAYSVVRLPGQGIYLAGAANGVNGSHAMLAGYDLSLTTACENAPQSLSLQPETMRTDHPSPAVTAGPLSATYTASTTPFYISKGNCPLAGVEEQQSEEAMLFPNPATEEVTVQFSQRQEGEYTLFDMQGREVSSGNFSGPSFVLHREQLSGGIYFLRISTKDGRQFSRKIVFSS